MFSSPFYLMLWSKHLFFHTCVHSAYSSFCYSSIYIHPSGARSSRKAGCSHGRSFLSQVVPPFPGRFVLLLLLLLFRMHFHYWFAPKSLWVFPGKSKHSKQSALNKCIQKEWRVVAQSTWLKHRVTSKTWALSQSSCDQSTIRKARVLSLGSNKNWSSGFEITYR